MTGPLITTAELAAWLDEGAQLSVLDVRWRLMGPPAYDDYVHGRIPGASFIDLERDLAGPAGEGGRHPLPDRGSFQAAMRRAGVYDESPVVVYDDADGTSAARAWWLLCHHGHRDVRLLDGGWRAWQQEARATDSGPPRPPDVGDFTAGEGLLPTLDANSAAALAHSGVLLDVRAVERYRGEVEPIDPVAGHIPGAVSAPTTANVDDDGRFHHPDVLGDRFAELGVDGIAEVGVYCGSGVTAAHQVLALELAGIRAALYPGSWSEWVRDPSRPVATGAQ